MGFLKFVNGKMYSYLILAHEALFTTRLCATTDFFHQSMEGHTPSPTDFDALNNERGFFAKTFFLQEKNS